LQSELLDDFQMAQEFRRAALRLCQAEFDASDLAQNERDSVLLWLTGDLRLISALKNAGIFQKVARHNARDMLVSLTRWLVKVGRRGLVLDLDVRRVAVAKRPDDGGLFYSKMTALDVYELLRQLIDSTDELTSCFVLVTSTSGIMSDPRRGFDQHYPALKMRIWDDVRDRSRVNPLAALIRLEETEDEEAGVS
jgi:hypothetical protein